MDLNNPNHYPFFRISLGKSWWFIFLLVLIIIPLQLNAQTIILIDESSGYPVTNAQLRNKNNTKTVWSDFDGKAKVSVFGNKEPIFISHPNFETIVITKPELQKRNYRLALTHKIQLLDEIVMSVSKWEQQKRDVPQKIATISSKEILYQNPQTTADMLQQSGKIFVQKSQLGGGSPMIRGFATNRVLITVDGVRMNNAIFRGGNVQNVISIDPFSLKNTELVFGPGTVIYGSDAIGGVMNFYSKNPRFSYTDSLTVSGNAAYRFSSANEEQTLHAEINYGKKKWAGFSSFSLNTFGDLTMGKNGRVEYLRPTKVIRSNGSDVLIDNPNPRVQTPTKYEQYNFLQKLRYRPRQNTTVDFGLHYSTTSEFDRYDRLIQPNRQGNGLRSAEWFYGPQKWLMTNLQYTQKSSKSWFKGLKINTAYQRFEESRNDRSFGDTDLFSSKELLDAYSLNLDMEHKKLDNLSLFYGASWVYNIVHSTGSVTDIINEEIQPAASRYPDGATWQSAAAYLSGNYALKPNLSVLSGLRYNRIWLNASFDNTFFDFPFTQAKINTDGLTGSLGFSWFPNANLQITSNLATAFRAPNIDDVGKVFDSEPGSVVVPNPDLSSEYAYSADLGIRKNFKDTWVIQATGYYTFLDNAMVRRDFNLNGESEIIYNGELSRVQAIQNAARANAYGLELGIETFFGKHWTLMGNLNLTQGTEEENDGTQTPARHVAPTFADLHLIWKNERFKTDVFVIHNGEISNNNLALSEQNKAYLYASDKNGLPFAPAWTTLNIRTQYHWNSTLLFNAAIENLTDQRYRPYSSGITAPGRNIIIGAIYTF